MNDGSLLSLPDSLQRSLHQSDLLFLDYSLEKPFNPTKALTILKSLSESDHFNLVVIYTGNPEKEVLLEIAFVLGAGDSLGKERRDEILDEIAEVEEENGKELKTTEPVLWSYLSGRKDLLCKSDLGTKLPPNIRLHALQHLCLEYFEKQLEMVPAELIKERPISSSIQISELNAKTKWLKSGNLFAAIVSKDKRPQDLVEHLRDAIRDWNPSPLETLLVYSRAVAERMGIKHDANLLEDRVRQAGLLLYIALSESDDEHAMRVHEISSILQAQSMIQNTDLLTKFGVDAAPKSDVPLEKILEWLDGTEFEHWEIYHACNEYLSTVPIVSPNITTGLIFREEPENNYWLCVTPACDLVPGRERRGWSKKLGLYRAVQMARLMPQSNIAECLRDATKCRHLFISESSGKRRVFEVQSRDARHLSLETIFLSNDGVMEDNSIDAFRVKETKGSLEHESMKLQAIARLRENYASRYLKEAGSQSSRIGVDYIPLPAEQPAATSSL